MGTGAEVAVPAVAEGAGAAKAASEIGAGALAAGEGAGALGGLDAAAGLTEAGWGAGAGGLGGDAAGLIGAGGESLLPNVVGGGGGGSVPGGGGVPEGAVPAPDVVPGAPPAGPGAPGTPGGIAPDAGVAANSTLAPPAPTTAAPQATGLQVGGGGAEGIVDPMAGTGGPVPATGAAPPSTPPTSGISKAMKSLGITDGNGGFGKNALPLGMNLGSAALQAGSKNTLQKQLQAIGQPASDASKQLLAEGTSGQVPPAVMQQFQQSLKQKTDEIVQRFANMGRDAKTDSAAQAEIQKAQDAMDAQVAQYASSLTTQGLQAAGVAAGPMTQGALAGAQQDQAFAQSQASALQQMALLEALSKDRGAVTPG